MDSSAKTDIRAFLMATAEREGIGVTAKAPAGKTTAVGRASVRAERATDTGTARPRRSTRTKVAVLVGVAVGTLALSGISAASGDAMPGDALYGVKRSQEHAEMALAGSAEAKAKLELDFAGIRLGEAQAIRANSHDLNATLGDMDDETSDGVKLLFKQAVNEHSTAPLDTVDAFLARQLTGLGTLRDGVVGNDAQRTLASESRINLFQLRSQNIRVALNNCAAVELTTDSLGPIATCAENGRVNPPSPTPKTNGNGNGKGGKGSSHGQGISPAHGAANGIASNPKSGADGITVSAGSTPTDSEGGLLGDIGHVLGGLLGH
jgi:hypothetical protein